MSTLPGVPSQSNGNRLLCLLFYTLLNTLGNPQGELGQPSLASVGSAVESDFSHQEFGVTG